jgi:hypothetical protein
VSKKIAEKAFNSLPFNRNDIFREVAEFVSYRTPLILFECFGKTEIHSKRLTLALKQRDQRQRNTPSETLLP